MSQQLTYRQIQASLGVSQHAVHNAIKRFSLPPLVRQAGKTPKEYYEEHREKIKAYVREHYRNHRDAILARCKSDGRKIKYEVFSHYSDGKPHCLTCSIDDLDVLCIDHLNGGGEKHRRELKTRGGAKFYKWLKANNYPDGYQVLCANCNLKKQIRQDMV